ncbi:MAG: DUF2332 domain-containing protein [Haloechinothrix sp.]
MSDLAEITRRLSRFAEETAGSSPLYSHLAARAAADDEVAGLLTAAPDEHARPTLLLAAAHRLIQADPIHPLSRYYPTLGGFDGVDAETWPMLRAFLLERADAARQLIATRVTRTNEVQRAALLYPAVAAAAKQARGAIALFEVGCAAGLLLGLDRFGYRYQCGGEQYAAGPIKTAVGLHCAVEVAAGATFAKPQKKLVVSGRIGLDSAPVDAGDEEELAWLEACVWADHPERTRLLRTAAAAQRKDPPRLVAGDAVHDLAGTAALLPTELPLVVFTSNTMAHLPEDRRPAFIGALAELAADRPLWWISHEPYRYCLAYLQPGRDDLAQRPGVLSVGRWHQGTPEVTVLATTDLHGQRMTWLSH